MLKTFMKEEKKLLKGLKTKYFYVLWWRVRRTNEIWKRSRRRKKKKEKEKIRRKAKKKNKKNKKKNQKKTHFSNILKINPKVSAMICLENILILKLDAMKAHTWNLASAALRNCLSSDGYMCIHSPWNGTKESSFSLLFFLV